MSNILSAMRPELVAEWSEKNYPLTPDMVTYGSNKVVWWQGKCGHEWQTSVKARSGGENCPICSGARVIEGINDLATVRPAIAAEWSEKNEILPTQVSIGSHKKVIWRCKHGHEWTASVKSRTINRTGCPYCSHNLVLEGFNDLATLYPEVAAEWSERNLPLLPTKVTAFANRKVWWKCSKGHEWHTLISTRSGGSKCPYCSGIKLLKGFNDLATLHPQLTAEWSEKNLPLLPNEVGEKSRLNVWWRCKTCGYEWRAVIDSRVKGLSCPVCAERAVLTGYNDLATTDPEILDEWDYEKNIGFAPEKISRNLMYSVWWKCHRGHSYKAKISDRAVLYIGCSVCEAEYRSVLLRFAVSYYGAIRRLKVETNSDRILGLPLETYIPEERLAIESTSGSADIEDLKRYLCEKHGIRLIKLPHKNNESDKDYLIRVKKCFQSVDIYISSDEDKDAAIIRNRYNEWRDTV